MPVTTTTVGPVVGTHCPNHKDVNLTHVVRDGDTKYECPKCNYSRTPEHEN